MTRTFNLSLIAALALGTSAMAQFTCPDLVSRTDTVNQSIGSKLNDVAMGDFTLSREPKIGDISTHDFKKATWELVVTTLSLRFDRRLGWASSLLLAFRQLKSNHG